MKFLLRGKESKMKLLLIGPQGSGKSTQGKLLEKDLHIPYISTGEIFRNIASTNTKEGRRIRQILDTGELVDDKTAIKLIKQRIQQSDCQNGFILDGYPRTRNQAYRVADLNFDKAFYLKLPQAVALERLLHRGRKDDTKELIKRRLNLYYQQTQPLLDYYKNKGILLEIDATGSIKAVQDEIKKFI